MRKRCDGLTKVAIFPQFLTSNVHFVRKGCDGLTKIAILPLHTLTSAVLDLHTLTRADLHLHTRTSADLQLHTFRSPLALLSISLLRRGRCRRSATKRNPFARNGRWTSKTGVKLRLYLVHRNPFARNGRWTSKTEVKLRF